MDADQTQVVHPIYQTFLCRGSNAWSRFTFLLGRGTRREKGVELRGPAATGRKAESEALLLPPSSSALHPTTHRIHACLVLRVRRGLHLFLNKSRESKSINLNLRYSTDTVHVNLNRSRCDCVWGGFRFARSVAAERLRGGWKDTCAEQSWRRSRWQVLRREIHSCLVADIHQSGGNLDLASPRA